MLVAARAIWSLASSIPGPFLTLYMIALGATPVDIGLVSALTVVGGMAVEPIGGYIADRRGRVKLVGLSTFGYAVTYIIFALASDWRWLGLGQILQQMFFFYSPGLNAILADSLPPGTRGRGYALERTFPAALGVAAPYLGGVLIAIYGGGEEALVAAMRQAYWIAFWGGLLAAFVRIRYLKETLTSDAPSLRPRDLPSILKEAYGGVFETIRWLPRSFRPIVYLQIVQSTFIAMAAPFWVLYAKQALGLSAPDWGTLMLFSGIAGIAFILPAGYLVDRLGSKKVVLFSMALAPVSVSLFMMAKGFWSCALVLIVLSLSNTMVTPSFASLIADMISRDRRGRVYALIGENGIQVSTSRLMGGGLLLVAPAAIGSIAGGYLYEWSIASPFLVMLVSLVACIALAQRSIREPEHPAL